MRKILLVLVPWVLIPSLSFCSPSITVEEDVWDMGDVEKGARSEKDFVIKNTGDEQLVIAANALKEMKYWKMEPHNELVNGSTEAYCLAAVGDRYLIYAPAGGTIKLNLINVKGEFESKWLDPRIGHYLNLTKINGGEVFTTYTPNNEDWVLLIIKIERGSK